MRYKFLLLLTCTPILLVSCSNSNTENFDVSNLKIPSKIKNSQKDTTVSITKGKEIITNKLVAYKNASQIMHSAKFGKNDPFSEEQIQENNLNSNFKLKGFLNTKNKNFVFVSYLGKEGTISEESIGGTNTFLLPISFKVRRKMPISLRSSNRMLSRISFIF